MNLSIALSRRLSLYNYPTTIISWVTTLIEILKKAITRTLGIAPQDLSCNSADYSSIQDGPSTYLAVV
jgi:hypothetical protein